jgi:hypothetical protein
MYTTDPLPFQLLLRTNQELFSLGLLFIYLWTKQDNKTCNHRWAQIRSIITWLPLPLPLHH